MEQEQQVEMIEARERRADYRCAVQAATTMNAFTTRKDGKPFAPKDFFFHFKSLAEIKETVGSSTDVAFADMDTAQQVAYLKKGFGLYVPDRFKGRVGLLNRPKKSRELAALVG